MKNDNIHKIAQELTIKENQIAKVLELTSEGNTIPFIARYRKEMTGNLDEVQIKTIIDLDKSMTALAERKATVLSKIEEQGKLTAEFKKAIEAAEKLADVEELYLPYKEKRRTKATIAREAGLFPLARLILQNKATVLSKIEEQGKLTAEFKKAIEAAEKLADVEELYLPYKEKRRTKATIAREAGLFPLARLILQNKASLEEEAQAFVCDGFETVDKAIAGACEILIESFSEDNRLRSWVYNEIWSYSSIISSVKDETADDKKTFQIYYDFSEKVSKMQGYRILALNRGEKLGILKVGFDHNTDKMIRFMASRFKNRNAYIDDVISKTIKKKIVPAMERRIHSELTESAEDGAIELFSENLRNLLLVSPLKGKMVLGFDPAFRTGAKLAVVDQTGKLMTTQVIYPVAPASQAKIEQSKKDLAELISNYGIEIIAIGNGTASRESEAFVAQVLKDFPEVSYVIVNESGASVYSASELARHEFPDLTVEKRSAISIARRLQDPLAELVKIDPKSIGVGQYQHDVSQKKLAENLDFVVDTVVNQVGVNINTASPALLSHVSGLNKTISENIVKYRDDHGRISSREEIKKVPRLGAKAFEQAAGFLRIPGAKNILDNTGVHPESYKAVERLLKELDITDLDDSAKTKLQAVSVKDMAETIGLGQETLKDIIADLLKPGRDLRDDFEAPVLRQDVLDISDLEIGQKLEGTVRNVVDFGAFVDIGLHDDGLIHISQMSKSFVKHPSQVVSVGDVVTVWVSKIDKERGKINLSLVDLRELN